jgi:hypothetical protein
MNKPARATARPLAELLHKTLGQAFARQGFASAEIVTRWPAIVGPEIAAHAEPERIQWPRAPEGEGPAPGILVLRVEGPTAIEIQHLSRVILDRVNGFFGWQAVTALRLRQAPLGRRRPQPRPAPPDPEATARVAAGLLDVADDKLRDALARLGAAVRAPPG